MFAGFTSRCTSPRRCAASSAAPTWPTTSVASTGSSRPRSAITRPRSGPVDVAHRDVELVGVLPRSVHRDNVRVVERGRDLGLALEPLPELLLLGQVGAHDL